jgi:hypothetical protein
MCYYSQQYPRQYLPQYPPQPYVDIPPQPYVGIPPLPPLVKPVPQINIPSQEINVALHIDPSHYLQPFLNLQPNPDQSLFSNTESSSQSEQSPPPSSASLPSQSNLSLFLTCNETFFSCHAKYLSAQTNGSLQWNRDKAVEWEFFSISEESLGKFSIRGNNEKYFHLEPNEAIFCNSNKVSESEMFTIDKTGNGFAVKSVHGKYLSVQPDGRVECNRDKIDVCETVTILDGIPPVASDPPKQNVIDSKF